MDRKIKRLSEFPTYGEITEAKKAIAENILETTNYVFGEYGFSLDDLKDITRMATEKIEATHVHWMDG